MRGILADLNVVGHCRLLTSILEAGPLREFWVGLNLPLQTVPDLGLPQTTSDAVLWQACQQQQLVLITDNRNQDKPDSLESAIRDLNTADSLPVITLANTQHIMRSKAYAQQVAERLLERLMEIESLRGTGRLYIP